MVAVTGHDKSFDVGENLDQSSAVQAACNAFGPSDLSVYTQNPALLVKWKPELAQILEKNKKDLQEKIKVVSPIHYLDQKNMMPPILILHGDRDLLVPVSQSIAFEKTAQKAGFDVELLIANNTGHGSGVFSVNGNYGKMIAFFQKHLSVK